MCADLTFHCSMCGECCRHIDVIPQLLEFNKGDGVCVHLKGNLCEIYDSRPDICRVDVMYEKKYCHVYSREEFYLLNETACNALKNQRQII